MPKEIFIARNRIKLQAEPLLKKCDIRFDISAKNVKIMGPKTEKNLFNLLNLSQKYRKMLDCSTRYSLNFFKFESLKIA